MDADDVSEALAAIRKANGERNRAIWEVLQDARGELACMARLNLRVNKESCERLIERIAKLIGKPPYKRGTSDGGAKDG